MCPWSDGPNSLENQPAKKKCHPKQDVQQESTPDHDGNDGDDAPAPSDAKRQKFDHGSTAATGHQERSASPDSQPYVSRFQKIIETQKIGLRGKVGKLDIQSRAQLRPGRTRANTCCAFGRPKDATTAASQTQPGTQGVVHPPKEKAATQEGHGADMPDKPPTQAAAKKAAAKPPAAANASSKAAAKAAAKSAAAAPKAASAKSAAAKKKGGKGKQPTAQTKTPTASSTRKACQETVDAYHRWTNQARNGSEVFLST